MARTTARDPGRRARIVGAARRAFVERGFRGTLLEEVARAADCSKGALYLEFEDKQSLLREVVMQSVADIRKRFDASVLPVASPLERLAATLAFAFAEFHREPLFARLLREDPDLEALGLASEKVARQKGRAQIEELAGWAREGIARGEIRADIDPNVIPFVVGLLRFLPLHLPLLTSMGAPGDAVLRAVVEIFRAGLAAPERAAPQSRATKARPARGAGSRRSKP